MVSCAARTVIVSQVKEGRSILLATHAMEEAELLCERVSILSRGDLKCIDHAQRLRERYCPGGCVGGDARPSSRPNVVSDDCWA
jgi:ABC-type multidrug transport system ATPase subunit